MKQLFLFICIVCSMYASAAYYIAGNGSAGSTWCCGQSWKENGCEMQNGIITFSALPIGSYQFKVTNGTWSTNYGFSSLDKTASNLYATGDGDGNVCFSLQAVQDVTITYAGSKITLTGTVGNQYPDESQFGMYGVPSEYEGVMLQCFYWDSYKTGSKYNRTKWIDLLNGGYASDMAATFDLVWMPPCGNGGGVGYYTKTYSNLDSDWGSKEKLHELLDTLHAHGCKALADVVVNHRASSNGWAKGFTPENFGTYGTFNITSEHICAGDEAFKDASSDSKSLPHGAADTGDNDAGCRDLDHTSTYVQDYIKAYTQWLLNTVGFDGFRYDMVKGYSGTYVSLYNQTSEPFFSVAEYWDGASAIRSYLETASYNTTCFDFATKYKFNDWKGGSSYSNLKNPGLRALGLSKYAVTFIDNHDTFERSDNKTGEFLGYGVDLTTKKTAIVQANAYLLSMPGTPCVFWPHWYTYPQEIKMLVALRKAAGIHSESEVTDEQTATNAYTATVHGHNGNLILRMGSARDTNVPAGYTLKLTGCDIDIYLSNDCAGDASCQNLTALEDVMGMISNVEKRIENGQLVIIKDGKRYDVMGREK